MRIGLRRGLNVVPFLILLGCNQADSPLNQTPPFNRICVGEKCSESTSQAPETPPSPEPLLSTTRALDKNFGGTGISGFFYTPLLALPDGRIIWADLSNSEDSLFLSTTDQDGANRQPFATVPHDTVAGWSSEDYLGRVWLGDDGWIYVISRSGTMFDNRYSYVRRFDIYGKPDLSFGKEGALRWENSTDSLTYRYIRRIVPFNASSWLAVEEACFPQGTGSFGTCYTKIHGLDQHGHPLKGFGNQGVVLLEVQHRSGAILDFRTLIDNKILLIEQETERRGYVRYYQLLSNGQLDSNFGDNGVLQVNVFDNPSLRCGGKDDDLYLGEIYKSVNLAALVQGEILIGVLCRSRTQDSRHQIKMAKLLEGGKWDLTYGIRGVAEFSTLSSYRFVRPTIQPFPDGSVGVLLGENFNSNEYDNQADKIGVELFKLNSIGHMDTAWAEGGHARIELLGHASEYYGLYWLWPKRTFVDAKGRWTLSMGVSSWREWVFRLLP